MVGFNSLINFIESGIILPSQNYHSLCIDSFYLFSHDYTTWEKTGEVKGLRGARTVQSTCLPPMLPGFNSWCQHHSCRLSLLLVLILALRGFPLGTLAFPLKTNSVRIWGPQVCQSCSLLGVTLVKQTWFDLISFCNDFKFLDLGSSLAKIL